MMSRLFYKKLFRIFPSGHRIIRVRRKRVGALGGPKKEYRKHKEAARDLVRQKLDELNRHYALSWGRITIRNQRSRWGSCSKKGNLNFNYRILHLPPPLLDYVIVHELCHLAEFNHSKKFWDLVARTVPDHHARRRTLRVYTLNNILTK